MVVVVAPFEAQKAPNRLTPQLTTPNHTHHTHHIAHAWPHFQTFRSIQVAFATAFVPFTAYFGGILAEVRTQSVVVFEVYIHT